MADLFEGVVPAEEQKNLVGIQGVGLPAAEGYRFRCGKTPQGYLKTKTGKVVMGLYGSVIDEDGKDTKTYLKKDGKILTIGSQSVHEAVTKGSIVTFNVTKSGFTSAVALEEAEAE